MKVIKSFCVCFIALVGLFVSQSGAWASCGVASWYHEGSRTANGERYRPDGISAAHKTLPFGTRVLVRNQRTGRSVTVRINDRGPFIKGRIIDLSRGAKRVIGMGGLAKVCLTILGRGKKYASSEEPRKVSKAKRQRAAKKALPQRQRYAQKRVRQRVSAKRAGRIRAAALTAPHNRKWPALAGWPGTDNLGS